MAAKKRKLETPKIRHDLPLELDEKADFNFDAFASTMARLIASTETRTPLVIGISGPWGSGKTTLLHRIEAMLKSQSGYFDSEEKSQFRPCKVVWFDAWKYQDESELLVALVRKILQEMQSGGLKDKFKAVLGGEEVAPEYDFVEMFINAFQFKFGGLGAELQVKFDPQKHRSESPFKTHTAFFDYFDTAFENLLALWVHGKDRYPKINDEGGALVIFIDDLDRCLPQKTVQVLEAVKLFLDKKGCIFVLGADADRVRDAVREHYKFTDGPESGEYLEKIIQLRFNLPALPDTEMGKFIQAQSYDPEIAKHWQIISVGAELNPRKVKTFLNDINLAWALLLNTGKGHDGIRDDFVRWQVLMRAAPLDFKRKVFDFDDIDLRFSFVQDALKWAQGGEDAKSLESYFEGYNKVPRLRRTLRAIEAFGPAFDAASLDDFLHLSAPAEKPQPEPIPEKEIERTPAEVKAETLEPVDEAPASEIESALEIAKGTARDMGEKAARASAREGTRLFARMEFMLIPKGKFIMGSKDDDSQADDDEKPQHTLDIPYDYWLGHFPVTNSQFAEFIEDAGYKTTAEEQGSAWGYDGKEWKDIKGANWRHPRGQKNDLTKKEDHPVVAISWLDAQAFVKWLNETNKNDLAANYRYCLPSEAEWEKAARGTYGNIYPWGNDWDSKRCNTAESNIMDTTPVTQFPSGESPFGCADMAGNVLEWTSTLWGYTYPYKLEDGRENEQESGRRVLRGGSFGYDRRLARCAFRDLINPVNRNLYFGFRVCVSPIS
jgi:formylglycine-generating enzyme required for sulfatase activity